MSEPRDGQYMFLSVMLAANTLAVLAVLAALVFGFGALREEMSQSLCGAQFSDNATALAACLTDD